MSSPEYALVFSPQAQSDYEAILAYSLRRWGEEQATSYEEVLLRALAHLQDRPLLGRARDDLRPGVRTFPVGQHLIVYEADGLVIRVARLLHQRMDVHRALHDE